MIGFLLESNQTVAGAWIHTDCLGSEERERQAKRHSEALAHALNRTPPSVARALDIAPGDTPLRAIANQFAHQSAHSSNRAHWIIARPEEGIPRATQKHHRVGLLRGPGVPPEL